MKEKGYWQFMNIGMPVILIIIFGIIQYFIRKNKYASIPKS
jgi:ABC-2 type transport system permease protein